LNVWAARRSALSRIDFVQSAPNRSGRLSSRHIRSWGESGRTGRIVGISFIDPLAVADNALQHSRQCEFGWGSDNIANRYSITSSVVASSVFRDGKAERLRGLAVQDKLKFCRGLDWQVAGLGAPQNTVDIFGRAAPKIGQVGSAVNRRTPCC
jgi:hypothetical protein